MTNFDRRLADQVAAELRAADLDLRPKIERRWLPDYEEADLTPPLIAVAPRTQGRTPGSRAAWRRSHVVQVGIFSALKPLPGGQVDEGRMDRLADLVEAVMDLLCGADPYEGASLTSVDTDPLYDPAALKSPGIFRAVLTLTYTRVSR